MDILYERLAYHADTLATAYTTNETTFATYKRAEQQWIKNKCDETGVTKEKAAGEWNKSRDAIVIRAQVLLGELSLFLASAPPSSHPGLRRQVDYLKEAVETSKIALDRYSNYSGGNAVLRQEWHDARGEVISRARPLIVHVRALVAPIYESGVKTEVGK